MNANRYKYSPKRPSINERLSQRSNKSTYNLHIRVNDIRDIIGCKLFGCITVVVVDNKRKVRPSEIESAGPR